MNGIDYNPLPLILDPPTPPPYVRYSQYIRIYYNGEYFKLGGGGLGIRGRGLTRT